jgi:hypothetical protein
MRTLASLPVIFVCTMLMLAGAARADIFDYDFRGEDLEEPGGAGYAFIMSPGDGIYGLNTGWGVWIKNTPVFGDYFVSFFENGIEDAFYTGFGLTIRLMPHWRVAPFAGAGGSYNRSWATQTDTVEPPGQPADRGESYAAGHVEAGVRVALPNRARRVEISGRYTWTSLEGNRNYWLVGLGVGAGW